jgi:hypothetical protein
MADAFIDLKNKARGALNRSVMSGKTLKPDHCSACGKKSGRIFGHHTDYSKPLEVIWLCNQCHNDKHLG